MITAKSPLINFIGIRSLTAELVIQAIRDLESTDKKIKKAATLFLKSNACSDICLELGISYERLLQCGMISKNK